MNNPHGKSDIKHSNKNFNSEMQSIQSYLKELTKDNLADMINKNALLGYQENLDYFSSSISFMTSPVMSLG